MPYPVADPDPAGLRKYKPRQAFDALYLHSTLYLDRTYLRPFFFFAMAAPLAPLSDRTIHVDYLRAARHLPACWGHDVQVYRKTFRGAGLEEEEGEYQNVPSDQ